MSIWTQIYLIGMFILGVTFSFMAGYRTAMFEVRHRMDSDPHPGAENEYLRRQLLDVHDLGLVRHAIKDTDARLRAARRALKDGGRVLRGDERFGTPFCPPYKPMSVKYGQARRKNA